MKPYPLRRLLLWIFIPLTVGPLVAGMIYSYFSYLQGMRSEVLRRGRLEVAQFVQAIQTKTIQLDSMVGNHAKYPPLMYAVLSGDRTAMERELGALRRLHSVDSAAVISPSGVVMARLNEGAVVPVDEPLVKGQRKSQHFVTDQRLSDGTIAVTAYEKLVSPVGRLIGYYQGAFVISQKWVTALGGKISGNIVLLTPDRQIFATSMDQKLRARLDEKLLRERFDSREKGIDIRGLLMQFEPLMLSSGRLLGYVGFAEPMDGVQEQWRRNFMGIFTLFLFAVAIVVVMVLLATKRITDPLRTLVRAAQDLPHTDVLVSTPQSVITEFHDLISSFNEMAHSVTSAKRTLEEKLQELQTANQSIRNAQGQLIQSAKMAGLGQLVAGVAHELNNPIGFIHANMFHLEDYCRSLLKYVEILEEKYPNPSEREKLEIDFIKKDLFDLIRSCQDGAKRTKDIVQGLKTFSRIDETSMKQTDINEGIQSTLKMLKSELKGATLDLQLADNLPKPLVYASLINQVWMNLILNAAHALPTVGGKILIKTLAEGDVVSVKISDNGSGIHPNDMDKIFEPFFTTKDVGKGTGLGLSICYNVIEKHGGHISVASKVNQGTTFHVTLPLRPPQSQTA